MSSARQKIIDARCRIQISQPWYGSFSAKFDWIESDRVETIGVAAHKTGRIACYFNSEWCNQWSVSELVAIIIHEIEHVVRLHIHRSPYTSKSDMYLFNVAADWVINGPYHHNRIIGLPKNHKTGKPVGCFIPCKDDPQWVGVDLSGITDDMTSEEYYKWLKNLPDPPSSGDGPETIDDHKVWDLTDASQDETRQIVRDMVRSATNIVGSCPAHLLTSISELNKPQHNWIHMLRNFVGRNTGGDRKTLSRINRRYRRFGLKGTSTHGTIPVTLYVDRSGSMVQPILRRVFTEVESLSQKLKITMIVFDTEVTDVMKYQRGDWKKIQLKGGGGTDFEAPIKYAEENGLIGKANIFLTDGECHIPAARPYPWMWAVVGSRKSGIWNNFKDAWGTLVPIYDDI